MRLLPRTGQRKMPSSNLALEHMEPNIACDAMLLPTAYVVLNSEMETSTLDGNLHRIYKLCEELFWTKQVEKTLSQHYSFVKAK